MPTFMKQAALSISAGVLMTLITIILFLLMGWSDWQLWIEPFFSHRHLGALIQCAGTSVAFYALSPTFDEAISVLRRLSVSILMAVLGGGAALALRELFIHSFRDLELVAAALLLIVVAASISWSIIDDASRHFRTFWESRQREFVPLIITFAAMLMFSDFVAPLWNSYIQPHVDFALSAAPQADDSDYAAFYRLLGSLDGLFGSIELTVTVASVTFLTVIVVKKIGEVTSYVQLTLGEIQASHRLREAAGNAISDTDRLSRCYVPFNIETWQPPMELPDWIGDPGKKALIKIFLTSPENLSSRNIDALDTILQRSETSSDRALFIIYGRTPLGESSDREQSVPSVIAYGTGSELMTLYKGAAYKAAFRQGLKEGDQNKIAHTVERARAAILANNPMDNVLLSTHSQPANTGLSDVLKFMADNRLERVLLTNNSVPLAHGILGLDDVSRYIYAAS